MTVLLTAFCFYYLSFSFVDRQVRKDATNYAQTETGGTDFQKRQRYLDSIYEEPVYNFLGMKEYTYKDVKEKGLDLGLDLQGGMHVTLEVSPVEILNSLAGIKSKSPEFKKAIELAREMQKNSQESFTSLFFKAYQQVAPGKPLREPFRNLANREYIGPETSDQEVRNYIESEVDQAVDRTEKIIRTRIDKFGVISPNIQRIPGTGRIQVELPGADNPERVRNLLSGVAKLEFLEVWRPDEVGLYLNQINEYLLTKEEASKPIDVPKDVTKEEPSDLDLLTQGADTAGTAADDAVAAANDSTGLADDTTAQQVSSFYRLAQVAMEQANQKNESIDSYYLNYRIKDTARVNDILKDPKVQAILPSNLEFMWEKPTQNSTIISLVPVKKTPGGKAPLTGEVITDARKDFAQDGRGYEIQMVMNSAGAKKWKEMTTRAVESERNQVPSRIAIALDNVIYSSPNVQVVIPNGVSVISGSFTEEEAADLANVLKAGKLPAPARIVEEGIIGPSLGKEAISQGLKSSVAGLVLVVVFMVLYYSMGGMVANFALVFNIFFILGVLAQLSAALTLPGIAGIVLTMGMAVDANVLIYERIREELRNGNSVASAIKEGYSKAFSSIFDANVTTLIIGIILAYFGSGPVQGFATTLIIGIVSSFFSSVFISRVIIEWMAKRKSLSEKSFETPVSKGLFKNINFDFIGARKKAYVFSLILIVGGIGLGLATKSYNLGVDFKGGRSYIVAFDSPVVASDVKASIADDFQGKGTDVKTYGDNQTLKITTSYLIDDETAHADSTVKNALMAGLGDYNDKNPDIVGSSKVGATIADDIMTSSMFSILLSLGAIFLYIFLRFRRLGFGLGGIIALAHDVLACIAVYGVASALGMNLEVDQIFIAAILTVIGYSINDTVVVFDRIRENMEKAPRAELGGVMNKAINETMSRTIITAATLFIVVIVLFAFGGEVLRGFSLVLILGTIFGTYSSVYIATPVVLDLIKKKTDAGKKDVPAETVIKAS